MEAIPRDEGSDQTSGRPPEGERPAMEQPGMPPAPPASPVHRAGAPEERHRTPVAAWVLIGLGVFFLLMNFGWWFGKLWPLILVAIGVIILLRRRG